MSTQNRRRSRSTSVPSSPISRSNHDDESWALSSKRAYPPSHVYVTYPPKWEDVYMWRRGKRTRRSASSSRSDHVDSQPVRPSCYSFSLEGGTIASSSASASTSSAPPTPHLASTSAEFNLFPNRHSTKSSFSSSHPQSDPACLSTDNLELDEDPKSDIDLTRLRSDAFWELRRSVAESGEGLVRRMRDYENSRSRSGAYSKAKDSLRRGRKRHSLSTRSQRMMDVGDGSDAEDDIQIFSGADVDGGIARKKRALSVGMADSAHVPPSPFTNLRRAERCFSPATTFGSGPSAYTSDDEGSMDLVDDSPLSMSAIVTSSSPTPAMVPVPAAAPALSHSFTTSNSSSVASLSSQFFGISSVGRRPHTQQRQHQRQHPTFIPTSTSSTRSEKAIAALSLALANGAGGINDYGALRAVETAPIVEDTQVGELWH